MGKWPKQVYSVEGSSTGHFTVMGEIGYRCYNSVSCREAVKSYVRECRGEPVKRRSTLKKLQKKRMRLEILQT